MKKYKRKKNRNLIKWLVLIFAILSTMSIGYSLFTDTLFINISASITPNAPTNIYTVIFDANSGTGTMNPQDIGVGIPTNLSLNTYEKASYSFECWTTMPDGTGTSYNDGESVLDLAPANDSITLYAKWRSGVARIGNTYYNTLKAAILAVPANNTETTVELLANVSENITIAANKNIVLDLKNHTVSSAANSVFVNNGTVKMSNGTILSTASNESAFDNKGTFYMSGGQIKVTNPDGKQAIYNDGGTLEISGSALISSASSETGANPRASLHNHGGTITILDGTIVSEGHWGIQNETGTLIIGTKDDDPDSSAPIIQGKTLGITSAQNYKFYNGVIRGERDATNNDNKITEVETGYTVAHRTEIIDGNTYQEVYLLQTQNSCVVSFNPNGGTTSEPSRTVQQGDEVGNLPTATRSGYEFLGWFTDPNTGTQIDEHTIISADITYYAHWQENAVAEINGTKYTTLQAAINAVPTDNTLTTITILKDVTEALTVAQNKNIRLDIQSYKLKNSANNVAVIENNGTIEVISGTITTNAGTGAINNNAGATFKISAGSILATGTRQAIYNSGTVEISGTAYLSSATTGTQNGYTLGRATVQNLSTGTLNITGGTIVGTKQQAISNEGTMTIGIKQDGNISISSPTIQGETYGICSIGTFNYYDGIIKGRTGPIQGQVTEIEPGAQIMNGSEVIGGKTYTTEYLQ